MLFQANYSPGCWNNMKRWCLSKLPTWIKSKSPATGITISYVLLFSTIMRPVALVGSDMISDGGVLVQMWPYTGFGEGLAGEYAANETAANSTETTTNSSSTELAADQEGPHRGHYQQKVHAEMIPNKRNPTNLLHPLLPVDLI